MRGEEIKNISLFTSIKKFGYKREKKNIVGFRGCANEGIVFCLVLFSFKMKQEHVMERIQLQGRATEEQRDHCEQWERRSAGQEEGMPPNVPVPESTYQYQKAQRPDTGARCFAGS